MQILYDKSLDDYNYLLCQINFHCTTKSFMDYLLKCKIKIKLIYNLTSVHLVVFNQEFNFIH